MAEQVLSYEQYLAALPEGRRTEVDKVWQVVRESMPAGFTEEIGPKFLTFKAKDEWYVALANQKNYLSLHLMPIYAFAELKAKLDESGKKLKGGKSCINFKRADDLPLEVVAEIIRAQDAEAYLAQIQRIRNESRREKAGRKRAATGP